MFCVTNRTFNCVVSMPGLTTAISARANVLPYVALGILSASIGKSLSQGNKFEHGSKKSSIVAKATFFGGIAGICMHTLGYRYAPKYVENREDRVVSYMLLGALTCATSAGMDFDLPHGVPAGQCRNHYWHLSPFSPIEIFNQRIN
jgi:hypothetical protein